MEKTSRTFVSLVKEFLSISGESLPNLSAEMKKLTPQDRADLSAEFEKMGFVVAEPAK